MTIPRIEPYPLPSRTEIPKNRLASNIDPSRAVLLVHDMQQYFLDFFGERNDTITSVLGNIVALRDACRNTEIPVVYTAQPAVQSRHDRGLLQDMWGLGITAYPERAQLAPVLAPSTQDLVLTKWRYSAFARTDLKAWMNERERTQLIICGVYAHIGCQCTAADAFMSDITPILVSDAVADFSRTKHLGALEYVAGCCGLVFDTNHLHTTLGDAKHQSPAALNLDVQGELRADVAHILEVDAEGLSPNGSLFDAGLDSVRLMVLIERWRAKGYTADLLDLAETPTISAWATKLKPIHSSVQ